MTETVFKNSLGHLRHLLKLHDASLEDAIEKAYAQNPWFIPPFCRYAIDSIAGEYLDEEKWAAWMKKYAMAEKSQIKVGIVMAGNVPLVGFHDLLCVLSSGHHALIKCSEKDFHLTKFITDQWIKIFPELDARITYTDRLEQFDAVIATGSNNTARYFEYYFRKHPHILRRNRNGVAVLDGKESLDELKALSKDIFLYYGLGCRNVSRIFVPEGYDFSLWPEAVEEWNYLSDHAKYRHNLDYNIAIYMINKIEHINLGHLILKEDTAIASRIGCLYYSFYHNRDELESQLDLSRNEIQCVIGGMNITGWQTVPFGRSQHPSLDQYADQVDTMKFLNELIN